jgi:hypothetical protein
MKLKRSFAIIFSMLVLFSFCAISQGKAIAQTSYGGTFDTWYYVDGVPTYDAKVVISQWKMGLTQDGRAWFFAKYIELNVSEEIPGTYDNFIVIMVTDIWEPISNGYSLEGTSYWWKNGILTYQWDTKITIDSEFYETQLRADFTVAPVSVVQIFGCKAAVYLTGAKEILEKSG